MRSEIMTLFFQLLNDGRKSGVAIKPAGKKEGCRNLLLPQQPRKVVSSVGKFITGKNDRYLFLRSITANDRSAVKLKFLFSIYFFFTPAVLPASLAASK